MKLHKKITPKEMVSNERKKFRKSLYVRNNYTESIKYFTGKNNGQIKLTNKKYSNLDRKLLEDALMTSIAGISAAIKNTG